jgi:hypothetical protein
MEADAPTEIPEGYEGGAGADSATPLSRSEAAARPNYALKENYLLPATCYLHTKYGISILLTFINLS